MVYLLPPVTRLKTIALDLLFPSWCINCGKEGSYICSSCRRLLSRIVPPVCPQCGRPQSQGMLCSGCEDEQPEIDGIRAPFVFSGVIRQAIHKLKYQNIRSLAGLLAEFLHDFMQESPVPGEVLVPVPLHNKRLRERGYNQSGLLAKELSKLSGLPLEDNCLVRRHHAPPQARSANIDERRLNITGAFVCRDDRLQDKSVVLIDDVSTSGITLDACASVLKSSGAASVWGLVVALEL
jgi:ComF family protein